MTQMLLTPEANEIINQLAECGDKYFLADRVFALIINKKGIKEKLVKNKIDVTSLTKKINQGIGAVIRETDAKLSEAAINIDQSFSFGGMDVLMRNALVFSASRDDRTIDITDLLLGFLKIGDTIAQNVMEELSINESDIVSAVLGPNAKIPEYNEEALSGFVQDEFMNDDDLYVWGYSLFGLYRAIQNDCTIDESLTMVYDDKIAKDSLMYLSKLHCSNLILSKNKKDNADVFVDNIVAYLHEKQNTDFCIFEIDIASVMSAYALGKNPQQVLNDVFYQIEDSVQNRNEQVVIYLSNFSDLLEAKSNSEGLSLYFILKSIMYLNNAYSYIVALNTDQVDDLVSDYDQVSQSFTVINTDEFYNNNIVAITNRYIKEIMEYHNVDQTKELRDIITSETIDLTSVVEKIDEASALGRIQHKNKINKKDFYNRIKQSDIDKLKTDKEIIKTIKEDMGKEIFGQDEAIEGLSNAVKLYKAGLVDDSSPVMSFLFVGPTGTGKTELAKVLSKKLNMHLERFDMSEYSESHTVSKLIGSPAGYVGYDDSGILTNAIRKNPRSILLLDEIEKAHLSIFNTLLQVLDYGKLTDNKGNIVDFSQTIIIMTSNSGSNVVNKGALGFGAISGSEQLVRNEIKNTFPPEFLNRISKIIWFNHIDNKIAKCIANKELKKLSNLLEKKKIQLIYDQEVINLLSDKGYSKEYGAREINRVVNTEIKPLMVDDILFGQLSNGGTCSLGAEKGHFSINCIAKK